MMSVRTIANIAFFPFLLSCTTTEQINPVGDWSGTLNLGGGTLRLIFHISESADGFTSTIESVDQGGAIIPTEMQVEGNSIVFRVAQLDVEYRATISGNQITGEFTQFGMSMPDFTVTRND